MDKGTAASKTAVDLPSPTKRKAPPAKTAKAVKAEEEDEEEKEEEVKPKPAKRARKADPEVKATPVKKEKNIVEVKEEDEDTATPSGAFSFFGNLSNRCALIIYFHSYHDW